MRKLAALTTALWLHAAVALAQPSETTAVLPASPADAPNGTQPVPDPAQLLPPTPPSSPLAEPAIPTDKANGAAAEQMPLSATELEALGFSSNESGEVSGLDTSFHLSGFADFTVSKLIAKDGSVAKAVSSPHASFYVGNFNLYLTKTISESFRTMAEVRFTYLPNGQLPQADGGTGTPVTFAADYADINRPIKWGGIEIERVYLEFTAHRYLTIRAGQFLTPYGIWNVDHGSPTFIPVQRPYVVGNGLFPERQTGFELFGRWDATNQGTLGYHFTLSNGMGPISEYRDLDDNKAVGGRIFWQQLGLGDLKVGGSFFYGKDTDATSTLRPNSMGMLRQVEIVHTQSKVLALALDAVWRYKGFLLQGEYISQQRAYTDAGRTTAVNPLTQQVVVPVDASNWGAYVLTGYRLPWYGVMPYFSWSYLKLQDPGGFNARSTAYTAGLNIRPIDAVVFKIEYSQSKLRDEFLGSNEPLRYFQTQVAWAF